MKNGERRMKNVARGGSPLSVLHSSFFILHSSFSVFVFSVSLCLCGSTLSAQEARRFVSLADGKLVYEADQRGNRIPDFGHCGYRGGGVEIPQVPVRVVVAPA